MVIDELKKRYRWVTEKGKILVVPLNQFEWKLYPINDTDNIYYATEDEFIGLATRIYMFDEDLKHIVPMDNQLFRQFLVTRPKRK